MQTIDNLDLAIIHAKHELNDLMGEVLYYTDRAWGINNCDDEDWCPTRSVVLNSMSEMLLYDFLVLKVAIEDMVAVHNEHQEEGGLILDLYWCEWLDAWDV